MSDEGRHGEDDTQRGFLNAYVRIEEGRADLVELARGLQALATLLVHKGVLGDEEVSALVGPLLSERERPAVRLFEGPDKYATPSADVDCSARIPHCRAVCCSMRVTLGTQDLEERALEWELHLPYVLKKGSDGRCTYQELQSGRCGAYERRPAQCRSYSCKGDTRVWRDFEGMVPNPQGIAALLAQHFEEPLVPLRRPQRR